MIRVSGVKRQCPIEEAANGSPTKISRTDAVVATTTLATTVTKSIHGWQQLPAEMIARILSYVKLSEMVQMIPLDQQTLNHVSKSGIITQLYLQQVHGHCSLQKPLMIMSEQPFRALTDFSKIGIEIREGIPHVNIGTEVDLTKLASAFPKLTKLTLSYPISLDECLPSLVDLISLRSLTYTYLNGGKRTLLFR